MDQAGAQDIELRSPAAVLVSQIEEKPPADEQPLAHRLQLEVANTRTVQEAIQEKNLRSVSSTFKAIIKGIPPAELVGNALQDVYKAASNVLVFRKDRDPPLTLKEVVDYADLTGNLSIIEASKVLGKILQAFGLITADFQPLPAKVVELRGAMVVLLEEQVYMHIQGTQVWAYCIRNLKHMTKLKEVAFSDQRIPVEYIWNLLSSLSYTKAALQHKTDTQAYFTLLMQAERLIERMTKQRQTDMSDWDLKDVESLDKISNKEDFEILVLKYIDVVVTPTLPTPEPNKDSDTGTSETGISIDDLWDNTDSPVTPAKRQAATAKQPHGGKRAKLKAVPNQTKNNSNGSRVNDLSINEMAQNQKHCKNWVSTEANKVRVMYRFSDEVEDILGEITGASYSEKTGRATWRATFNDSRTIDMDLNQAAGAIQYYKIWAAKQRQEGCDPDEVVNVDHLSGSSGSNCQGRAGKRKHTGPVNVKVAMQKLSKADKKTLDEWCDELDGSLKGARFVDSDEEEEALEGAEGDVDHLSIFEEVRGENFSLLREALQFPPSNPKYERVRSCIPVEEKVRRVQAQLRDEMNVVLDHTVLLPIVFGASRQVKSFSALVQAVKGVDDDFGIDHKDDAVYLQANGSLHPVEQKRDWRKTKSLSTVGDCLAAGIFFQRTLELWHPGMDRYTGGIAVAMQRHCTNSGDSPRALRRLLQTMWQSWCASVTSIISVSKLPSRSSQFGWPMKDIAVHRRYHVRLLPEDFWNSHGKDQCITVRNEAREEQVVKLQQTNADMAVRLSQICDQVDAYTKQAPKPKAPNAPGTGRKAQARARKLKRSGAGAGAGAGASHTPAPAPAPAPAPRRNANPSGPDPVLGFTVNRLSNPADVKAAILAAGHATLRDAQLAFAASDTTTHNAAGKGGCFWMKSDIGKLEGKCPYASKCQFQH